MSHINNNFITNNLTAYQKHFRAKYGKESCRTAAYSHSGAARKTLTSSMIRCKQTQHLNCDVTSKSHVCWSFWFRVKQLFEISNMLKYYRYKKKYSTDNDNDMNDRPFSMNNKNYLQSRIRGTECEPNLSGKPVSLLTPLNCLQPLLFTGTFLLVD